MVARTQAQVPESQNSDTLVTSSSVLPRSLNNSTVLEPALPQARSNHNQNADNLPGSAFQENFSQVPVGRGYMPFVQPKLVVGQPNDKYEQEADRVANEVMSASSPTSSSGAIAALGIHQVNPQLRQPIQRQMLESQMDEEEDDEAVQAKLLSSSIQPMGIGNGDRLQRQTDSEEEDDESVQAKQSANHPSTVPTNLNRDIKAAQGSGQPLPPTTRTFMESRFQHDFSHIRVHNDGTANRLAKSLNAQAFTHKQNIFFGSGRYQPHTSTGQKLLAHELTHTVQQQPSLIKRFPQPSSSTPIAPHRISEGAAGVQNFVSLLRNPPSPGGPATASPGPLPPAYTPSPSSIVPAAPSPSARAEGQASPQNAVAPASDRNTPSSEPSRSNSTTTQGDSQPTQNATVNSPEGSGALEAPANKVGTDLDTSSAAEGAGGEAAIAPAASLNLSGSSDQAMAAFLNANPSQIAATQPSLGAQLDSKISQEQQDEAKNAPVLVAKTSGTVEEGVKAPEQVSPPGTVQIDDGVTGDDPGDLEAAPQEDLGAPPTNTSNEKLLDRQDENSFLDWFRTNRQSFLNTIRTTDQKVNTSAGERPQVKMEGEADPNRMANQRGDAEAQLKAQRDSMTNSFKQNPGQQNIKPKAVNEEKTPKVTPESAVTIDAPADTGAMDYANAALPADVRRHADELLKPTLDGNLAEAKAQARESAKTRDQDKADSINQAQADTAATNQNADKEQRDLVIAKRQEVAQQQQEGIQSSYDQVNEFMTEADKEQAANQKEIGDRVKTSEGDARKELEAGEKEAENEKKAKEKEAADKKRELEKSQESDSWWDRAVSAVKSAVKAITSAIDTIFTKLREAVKTIIEKAKDAAIGLINKAREWVIDKLNKFRDWAKDKVNTYLKDRFPNLAKHINEGIDSVVDVAIDGVNKVADAAIAGVEAVADGLAAALDKILSVYQTALKAAVQIAGAVITGDFAEALRVALQAACDIAGIDSKPIFSFIDRAAGQVMAILKNPKTFFNNVMKAIGGGVSNFAKNIKQHLIKGLLGWLTGALSETNISMPKSLDVKGILSLVMQVLGLTYENIKAKVIKKYPPAAKVIAGVEKGIAIVQKLVTEGPMALWEELQQKFSNLKEMVISGIKDFVIKTVVKEGISWLLGLLTPVGAIAKLLKLIFDFVMFLVERFQQIKDFVMSVYESVTAIASGNLSQAKKAVENAMSRSLPVVISMIASLAGLGGIGKTVKNIIGKVAKPVNKIVDALIERMVNFAKKLLKQGKKIAKKAKKTVLSLIKWWTRKKKFTTVSGEQHTLKFKGDSASAKLMVNSKPSYIKTFIKKEISQNEIKERGLGLVNKTENTMRLIKKVDRKLKSKRHDRALLEQQRTLTETLSQEITDLSTFLSTHIGKPIKLPEAKISYTASKVSAELLSPQTPKGGVPTAPDVPGYQELQAAEFTSPEARKDNWVRMHVLNRHLGGSGADKHNLVMGPSSVNLGPEMKSFEGKLKKLLKPSGSNESGRYAVIWMDGVKVKQDARVVHARNGSPIPLGLLSKQIKYSAGFHKQKSENKWTKQPAIVTGRVTIPPPDIGEDFVPSLKTATPLLLKRAYRRSGGIIERADAAFKHPAVPELRGSYSQNSEVIDRIQMLNIPEGQKNNLRSVMQRLLNGEYVTL